MAHDANFVDNRLRTTAFLRVVKHGMPARPSRFSRRTQPASELDIASDTVTNGQADIVPLRDASIGDAATLDPTAPNAPSAHDSTDSSLYVGPGVHLTAGQTCETNLSRNIFDSPCTRAAVAVRKHLSPQAKSCSPMDNCSKTMIAKSPRRLNCSKLNTSPIGCLNGITRVRKSGKSASAMERCSAAKALTLVRTTTIDGLPIPIVRVLTFLQSSS